MRRRPISRIAALVALTIVVTAAPAASASNGPRVARDISFPQCGGPLPRLQSGSLGVLGTNNGTAFTRNPCLTQELAWAKRLPNAPAFYANTGNPGPSLAKHWPIGQTSPKVCSAADPNSVGCSYDYGWNAGWQSYSSATDAAQRLHHIGRDEALRRAANVEWWLDIETMNSWLAIDGSPVRSAQLRDTATIVGEIDVLHFAGVARVGIYSTPYQWNLITGGSRVTAGQLGPTAQWLAGYDSKSAAIAGCSDPGFLPGPVHMTQYFASDGFDADIVCPDPDRD